MEGSDVHLGLGLMMVTSASSRMTDERLEWYFWVYEMWYLGEGIFYGGKYADGKYPSRAAGAEGYQTMTESDSAYMKVCQVCAEHVNAIVDGLPGPENMAIRIKHFAAAPAFLFKGDLETVYARAREEVRRILLKRGLE